MGDTDGRFCRPVAVIQRRGQLGTEPVEEFRRENLTAAPHVLQRIELIGLVRQVQQYVEHGRDQVDEGDRFSGDQVEQVLRVAFPLGLRDHQSTAGDEREQDLVDRDVEREWGFEQGGIAGPEPENPLPLPQQPCADCLVADHGALRTSGRTGREDDVCELGTVNTNVGGHCLGQVRGPVLVRPRGEIDRNGVVYTVRGEHQCGTGIGEYRFAALCGP
eukprot:gene24578-biopygen21179